MSGLPPAFTLCGAVRSKQAGEAGRLLVVAEVGLALATLVTLGLLLRSLHGLRNAPAGLDHRNVTVCRLFPVTNNYTPKEEQRFSRQLREFLLSAPGVTDAACSDSIPLGFGLGKRTDVTIEGYAPSPGENLGRASRLDVLPGLRQGRVKESAGELNAQRLRGR